MTTIRMPSRARRRAMAAPMPRDAPVTMATLAGIAAVFMGVLLSWWEARMLSLRTSTAIVIFID
ncbi:hypothetical protein OX459_22305 [Janthinobacterium sp. SUN026]|uniref:hypothetical protein n=1 Tax=Janthinobacterium sp. SUN026 TaxID=3002438 RepID=UPI0025B236FA|nr:hypothetical protein [Janthinobacterium sp. SUN026]MDN2674141.1 hypothetical protein [Janthinobacterium sp. SUN026]